LLLTIARLEDLTRRDPSLRTQIAREHREQGRDRESESVDEEKAADDRSESIEGRAAKARKTAGKP
jgi:hypothetical protein